MRVFAVRVLVTACLGTLITGHAPVFAADGELSLNLRSRAELEKGSGIYRPFTQTATWDAAKTAIVICDMWDQHWCAGASRRVAEMAPRMNDVVRAARERGIFIIHCPSGCMAHYEGTPQRKLARQAPKAEAKVPLQGWCHLDKDREGPLPIDDSDGGCDCWPQCKAGRPWKKQIDSIEIAPGDAVTDSAEAYYLMRERGIENVIVMGVHANMCVLGRPFSIRQLTYQGLNVALMRDMTDTMYNSRMRPFVSHFTGNDLIVEHIERSWCPTLTSADFLGGRAFRFAADRRPHLAIVLAEDEYGTKQTVPKFARQFLGKDFRTSFVFANPKDRNDLAGIEVLNEADLALLAIRRRVPPQEQLDVVRKFIADGKPLVAIRTSSHAFSLRGQEPPKGHADWPDFDREVLGCNYHSHHPSPTPDGPKTLVWAFDEAKSHPILRGFPDGEIAVPSSLYLSQPLVESATPLVMGRFGDVKPHEPVAWTNTTKAGGRVFYTSLGHAEEFEMPAFGRLLLGGIYWAAGLKPPTSLAVGATRQYDDWTQMQVPGTWDEHSGGALADYDGYAWYRCAVKLPTNWKNVDLELFVEQIDNAHEAYFNGQKIGDAGAFPPAYESGLSRSLRYRIVAGDLRPGEDNIIAIRVYDEEGRGGFKGTAPALFNERMAIDLTGRWEFRTGDDVAWAGGPLAGDQAVFAKVDKAADIVPRVVDSVGVEGALSPAESAKQMHVAEDLRLEQVLADPVIAQPLSISFDERGRLWLVEYRQYPHPAGLKMVSRDNFWRAVYDKVPPPPPHHVRGKDRVSIHEDTDGDGTYDKHGIFVDGLNITTAAARGRGGVWVLNPPYLLFYPDKNNDDVPDGDPEVHLEGFGLEDTHSVTNSLRWGPDGWLYATQGSTVSGAVKRPGIDKKPVHSMGQLVWRYHPENRRYEIFAEGGGNAFGLEFDAKGRVYSGYNGGDTRGFHYVQGGYYKKGFSKHGPLSNPYSFGYFEPMGHPSVPRFTHTFLIYEAAALPDKYQGKLFGVEPLQSQIVETRVIPDGSSFRTEDVSRPVASDDKWFRPVDIKTGPDGAIYIADWYDAQVNHYRNHEGKIDPESGRIYRLTGKQSEPNEAFNLAERSSAELVDVLRHENKWYRQTALQLLGDRRDSSILPLLKEHLAKQTGQFALECLWALNLSGGLDERAALELLSHSDPHVRLWTVRLVGDAKQVSPKLAAELEKMAAREPHVEVRSQLACSARRLPPADALPIVASLLTHDEDSGDVHIPLLLWWAVEAKAGTNREAVLAMFSTDDVWRRPLVRDHLLDRLMRRYAMAGTRNDLLTCAKLLDLAPDKESAGLLIAGFEKAYEGRSLAGMPDALVEAIARHGGGSLALRLRRGDAEAVSQALLTIADEKADLPERLGLIEILGQIDQPQAVPVLLGVVEAATDDSLRQAALTALQPYDESPIAGRVVSLYGDFSDDSKSVAQTLLASRRSWAEQLLLAVDEGRIAADSLPLPVVRKVLLHGDGQLESLVRKHWGAVQGETTAQMKREIERLAHVVTGGYGSPYRGKALYLQHCGKCHTLFGEGGKIGPDLTSYKRDNLDTMMLNVVNPSAEIREGFENFVVITDDGRVLNGFIADQDNRVVVVRGVDGQSAIIPREEIEEMRAVGQSVMPENVLKPLSDEQVRDLFAYLRSTQPLNN